MHIPLIIIGAGLSGLAAGIRCARFNPDVLILEKHSRIGGLNSYYYRNHALLETGLHAVTNFAPPTEKAAPLNRLLRQLKLRRQDLDLHEQIISEVRFTDRQSLLFSNNIELLRQEIASKFPASIQGFTQLLAFAQEYDPFAPLPFRSARAYLAPLLHDELLVDMLLCPLMYYGSSRENDMDLGQFVIMFRAIFLEGMFRPHGTIKDLLDLLLAHYQQFGGKIRLQAPVARILHKNKKVVGVELASGEVIECDALLSTIGHEETLTCLGAPPLSSSLPRMGFVESIFRLELTASSILPVDRTIVFYNSNEPFTYQRPAQKVDFGSGVICFPQHFQAMPSYPFLEVRATHLANYQQWKTLAADRPGYLAAKAETAACSLDVLEKIIGNFKQHIVYQDTFTPLTIERFTAKKEGAIYGAPDKIKDGDIGYHNLFLAGTDQGFLGIVGSMLSGVSMVNQHILPRL